MIKKLFDERIFTEEEKREIADFYSRYHRDAIEPLTEEAYDEFRLCGRRIGYEKLYFDRRRRIDGCVMMYRAFGGEYLRELCGLLDAVCGEKTWALPAHTLHSADPRTEIDLFAAETAQMLTEIGYLLSDVLPEELRDKMAGEVSSRVIDVFEERRFGWETSDQNWSAVCGGCIGMVYLYRGLPVPQRALDALGCYLSGINDDGVCLEGVGYWGYGFGYYMYFAALYKERCGVDLMASPKVGAIARFGQNVYLGQNAISCSDCGSDVAPLRGLTSLLHHYFDGIYAPEKPCVRYDDCGRWADYVRSYLYPLPPVKKELGEVSYPVSQWYINKKKSFSFFIKGGNNDEPHNHNDIGSFIIASDRRQLLCDLGCGEYTKDYFDDSKRYGYLCNSSAGHSVPIVDGKTQMPGAEYRALGFQCGSDRAELEIGSAYQGGVGIRREVAVSEDAVRLCDSFSGAGKITERFVTKICPVERAGNIYLDGLAMPVPDRIAREQYANHSGEMEDVYLLDYEVEGERFEIVFACGK